MLGVSPDLRIKITVDLKQHCKLIYGREEENSLESVLWKMKGVIYGIERVRLLNIMNMKENSSNTKKNRGMEESE